MHKLKVFIAESVSHEDFYDRDWEGHAAEEIVRLLNGRTRYRIVLDKTLLRRAIKEAAESRYGIFHLSCHGDENGVQLSGNRDVPWRELAEYFQEAKSAPAVLVLSSCVGGDGGIARAFEKLHLRPAVIFGAEAKKEEGLDNTSERLHQLVNSLFGSCCRGNDTRGVQGSSHQNE
jgi:hypothetical protein